MTSADRDPYTGEKLWYKDASAPGATTKTRKKLLPEKYRRLFSNKQIVCVEYADITSSDEREIFQRVQLGMALTPAEKLQVINTSRASYVRELLKDYVDDEERGLAGEDLDWDRSRGADFRCLAQSVHLIAKWKEVTTVASIPQLEKWLSSSEPLEDNLQQRIRDVYDLFRYLVHDSKLNKVFKKPTKISPVEFVIIPVLISACGERMGMAQLSAAIGKMRDEVRKAHVDIRLNNRVSKWMIEYVEKLAEGKVRDGLSAMAEKRAAAAAAGGGKRKRQESDDSTSETEHKPRKTGNMDSNSNRTEQSSGQKATPPMPTPVPKKEAAPTPTSTASSTPAMASRRVDRLAAVRMAKEMAATTRNISANAGANGVNNTLVNTSHTPNNTNISSIANSSNTSLPQVPPHPMQQATASQMMPMPMPPYASPLPMSPNPQAMPIPMPMMPPGVLNSSLISQLWGQLQQQPGMGEFNPSLMTLQPNIVQLDGAPQYQQSQQQQPQPQRQPNQPQTHPLPPHPQQGEYRYGPNVSTNTNPPRGPKGSTGGGGQQGHFMGPVDSGWGSRGRGSGR